MMKTESLKKLGILGVSFGLMASPLAFADMHEEDEPNIGTQEQEEAIQEEDKGSMNSFDSETEGQGTTTYEEEEEEQEDWETTEEDDAEEDADW
ncbi:hypothetical protein SAMN04487958_10164 [Vreelandella subterranea]|uniref:Uncharacterized protein n=1 Tax=Vreelandella subterranea TaxID=416874 RepID=A0A1H9P1W7_9GAMM|nr:hypothetical protein [Halomonas subterranea]SER42226.1 hypothetical protein SAMN04487958_10164 [Halomonas subterranea]